MRWLILFFTHVFLYWSTSYYYGHVTGSLSNKQIIPLVLFNQLLSMAWYPLLIHIPMAPLNIYTLSVEIAEILVVYGLIFGALHSLIHDYKPLRWIHDIHHSLVIPTPSGAFYAHPAEHLLVTIGTVIYTMLVCTLVLPLSFEAIYVFTVIGSINTVFAHRAGTYHAYHHSHGSKNRSNYPPMWDWLMGTFVEVNK